MENKNDVIEEKKEMQESEDQQDQAQMDNLMND